MLILVHLFALRASSRCKYDMGAHLWLNAEALERAPTTLFDGLVRCSAHGRSIVGLQYASLTLILYANLYNKFNWQAPTLLC